CFFFQAEDGIRDLTVTGVQTCALPISIDNCTWDSYNRSIVYKGSSMSRVVSMRFREGTMERLQRLARRWGRTPSEAGALLIEERSEERRVGKECRCGWWTEH